MSRYTLLRNHPDASPEFIQEHMDGNLCRCTGYRPILDAAKSLCCGGGGGGGGCCGGGCGKAAVVADGAAVETTTASAAANSAGCIKSYVADVKKQRSALGNGLVGGRPAAFAPPAKKLLVVMRCWSSYL